MARYDGWYAKSGESRAPSDVHDLSRKLLGEIANDQRLGGPPAQVRRKELGEFIVCAQILHGQPRVWLERKPPPKGRDMLVPHAWVACSTGENVCVVNLVTGQLLHEIDCGAGSFPQFLARRPRHAEVWAACQLNPNAQVKAMSPGGDVLRTLTIEDPEVEGGPSSVGNMCFSEDGMTLYIAVLYDANDDNVAGIYLNAYDVEPEVPAPLWSTFLYAEDTNVPFGVCLTPDDEVLVSDCSASLYVIAHRVTTAGVLVGDVVAAAGLPLYFANEIVLNADGTKALVSALGFRAFIIDLETFLVTTVERDNTEFPGSMISATFAMAHPFSASRGYLSSRDSATIDVIDLDDGLHVASGQVFELEQDVLKLPETSIIRGLACVPEWRMMFVTRQDTRTIAALSLSAEPVLKREYADKNEDDEWVALFEGDPWDMLITTYRQPADAQA